MLALSAFTDEASPTLEGQVQALEDNGLRRMDLRWLDDVNVADLPDSRLEELAEALARKGFAVQAIGSPVNKVDLSPEAAPAELAKLRASIHAGHKLGTRLVRVFSPRAPEDAWPQVEAWMAEQAKLAQDEGAILLHENDARFYGAFPEGARRLMERFAGPSFRFAFDFANAAMIGHKALDSWFPWLVPYVHTLHMKDWSSTVGANVPCGEGDGQVIATLQLMLDQGWTGTLTLEPHLSVAGPFGGHSGPELFAVAVQAMRRCVAMAGGQAE